MSPHIYFEKILEKNVVEAVLGEIVAGFVGHEGLAVAATKGETLVVVVLVVSGHMSESERETCSRMDNSQVVIFLGEDVGELSALMVLLELVVGELDQAHRIRRVTLA